MGYPGAPLTLYDRPDYVRVLPEDAPSPVLSQPQASPVTSPQPAASDAGGSFWSSILDLAKNIPITIGGPGRRIQLPSYNQMTAGTRLLEQGRTQGLDLPRGSASLEEAQFMVQNAARQRLTDPMGMDEAQKIMVPQAGELPSTMQTRAWLARLPRSALQPLLLEQIQQQGGLPGFEGAELDLSMLGANLPRRGETAGTPAPALPQPATPPPPAGGQGMPQPPGRLPPITYEDVATHPTVVAAQQLLKTAPGNRKYRELYAQAWAKAEQDLRKTRHEQYGEQSQEFRNQLAAQTAHMTMQKALAEAQRAPYGYGQDWDAQIRMDYALPPGQMPTGAQAQASYPRMVARLQAAKAGETAATTTARLTAEQQTKLGYPLTQALSPNDPQPFDTTTGYRMTTGTLGQAQQRAEAGAVRFLPTEQAKRLENLQEASVAIRRVNVAVQRVYDIAQRYQQEMTPEQRANPLQFLSNNWSRVVRDNPELLDAQREIEGSYMAIATGVMGGDKRVSQEELRMIKTQFPNLFVTMDTIGRIGGRIGNWVTGGAYANLPIGAPMLPDTREVATSTMDGVMGRVNEMAGNILQKPDFQFAGLTPRSEAERTAARAAERRPVDKKTPTPGVPTTLEEKLVPGPIRELPGYKKAKEKLFPPTPAAPTDAMATVRATALRRANLKTFPNVQQDPQGFQAFLQIVHEQVQRYYPAIPEAQRQAITAAIAQHIARQQGASWPPPQP